MLTSQSGASSTPLTIMGSLGEAGIPNKLATSIKCYQRIRDRTDGRTIEDTAPQGESIFLFAKKQS
jgi:hypothetical protein